MPLCDVFNPRRLYGWLAAICRVRRAYTKNHGRNPRLLRPTCFTEKIQWRKLFDLNPVYAILSDKLAVRDFVAKRVGAEVLIPLLWAGNDPNAIPFDELDPPYVIKSTHSSGQVLFVRRREDLDANTAMATFRAWLASCHGTDTDELGYVTVPKCLMVERMLLEIDGSAPTERRFFIFDGRVRFVQTTFADAGRIRHGAFHDRAWCPLDWHLRTPSQPDQCPRPKRYDDMIAIAEGIGKDFDHLRVDVYELGENIWVGELTLYSWSGMIPFSPNEADELVGSYWSLRSPVWQALKVTLWNWRKIPPGKNLG